MAKKKTCEWCEFTDHVCEQNPECDFKTLPVKKDAILERMKVEYALFKAAKGVAASTKDEEEREERLRVALDKVVGMNFMAKMLEKKFNVPPSQSFAYAGWEKPSLLERVKLMKQLSALRKVKK